MGDGIQVQVTHPLVETSISGPIGIYIFPVLFVRKYGQGHKSSFLDVETSL